MKTVKDIAVVFFLMCASAFCLAAGKAVSKIANSISQIVDAVTVIQEDISETTQGMLALGNKVEVDSNRALLQALRELGLTRQDFASTQDRALILVDAQLTGTRDDLDAHLGHIETDLNQRLEDITGTVVKVREDIQPTIQGVNLLMRRDALPAQILGTLGATKVAMGQIAQTSIKFEDATPMLLAGVQTVIDNSNKTTEATAGVMANLKKATTPLPTWMRLGLAIAPSAAQVALPVVTLFR